MNQLKNQNPQAYQFLVQAKNSGTNPKELVKQFTDKATPQELSNLLQVAKQYGVPDDILSQIQNNNYA